MKRTYVTRVSPLQVVNQAAQPWRGSWLSWLADLTSFMMMLGCVLRDDHRR